MIEYQYFETDDAPTDESLYLAIYPLYNTGVSFGIIKKNPTEDAHDLAEFSRQYRDRLSALKSVICSLRNNILVDAEIGRWLADGLEQFVNDGATSHIDVYLRLKIGKVPARKRRDELQWLNALTNIYHFVMSSSANRALKVSQIATVKRFLNHLPIILSKIQASRKRIVAMLGVQDENAKKMLKVLHRDDYFLHGKCAWLTGHTITANRLSREISRSEKNWFTCLREDAYKRHIYYAHLLGIIPLVDVSGSPELLDKMMQQVVTGFSAFTDPHMRDYDLRL